MSNGIPPACWTASILAAFQLAHGEWNDGIVECWVREDDVEIQTKAFTVDFYL